MAANIKADEEPVVDVEVDVDHRKWLFAQHHYIVWSTVYMGRIINSKLIFFS